MTVITIDRHEYTHTCPTNPQPHVVASRQRIVGIAPGGECLTPVTVRVGGTPESTHRRGRPVVRIVGGTHTQTSCGILPFDKQCDNCRITIQIRATTCSHLGAVTRSCGASA